MVAWAWAFTVNVEHYPQQPSWQAVFWAAEPSPPNPPWTIRQVVAWAAAQPTPRLAAVSWAARHARPVTVGRHFLDLKFEQPSP